MLPMVNVCHQLTNVYSVNLVRNIPLVLMLEFLLILIARKIVQSDVSMALVQPTTLNVNLHLVSPIWQRSLQCNGANEFLQQWCVKFFVLMVRVEMLKKTAHYLQVASHLPNLSVAMLVSVPQMQMNVLACTEQLNRRKVQMNLQQLARKRLVHHSHCTDVRMAHASLQEIIFAQATWAVLLLQLTSVLLDSVSRNKLTACNILISFAMELICARIWLVYLIQVSVM